MHLVVIGGGAAGFFCALAAAKANRECRVTILEKSGKVLSKVRVSGGGRCNVTHACFSIPDLAKKYPRGQNFVKKTFHQFFTEDTIDWFRKRGVILKTEPDGRMFPVTDSSETIISCLLKEADSLGVKVIMQSEVKGILREGDQWKLITTGPAVESADAVCVATGGYPKEGMYQWLRSCGHTIETPVPSLFTFNIPQNSITGLMGVSTNGLIKIRGTKFEEEGPILVTHWGLSGPAVLKLSARAARELAAMQYQFTALVNWYPELHDQALREKFMAYRDARGRQLVTGKNELAMPHRLWEYLCDLSQVPAGTRWADLTGVHQNALMRNIHSQELNISGKTTYKEEFVTAGGIRLSEINAHSMESKLVPRLYFAGEVMDVDGVTGGFNFQHAWTSGWIAGRNMAAPPVQK